MQTSGGWNSLEGAKLLVSTLTPIIVAVLGIWIARMTKRFEQRQWAGQKIIERRIDVYDEIAPMLNDLVVYFTFVGHWKELRPPQMVELKRLLDRRVHVAASLFSSQLLTDYFSFIALCFATYQGWSTDARLRMDSMRYKQAAGPSWNAAWDAMFCEALDRVDPEQVRSAYQKLMETLAEELQLGLQPRSIPSGRVPGDAFRENIMLPVAESTPDSQGTRKPVKPYCFYRLLPQELRGKDSNDRADSIPSRRSRLWPTGSTLRIRFLDGLAEEHDAVRKFAFEWTDSANLTFEFREDPSAEIRITFVPSKGSWSYIGTDCLQVPSDAATMNLASVDKGTILHLFGLALGLMPENQNPAGGFSWNRETILKDLSVCPDYSTDDAAEKFLENLNFDQLNGPTIDKFSVMLMAIPDDWTVDKIGIRANSELSARDKALISSLYPRN